MDPTQELKSRAGTFVTSLTRNNKQIRDDRALAIVKATEKYHRRKVEDIADSIDQLEQDQENSLDLSPKDAQSLVMASDFNSGQFVQDDVNRSVKIHNEGVRLQAAKERYYKLFGPMDAPTNGVSTPEPQLDPSLGDIQIVKA